MAYNKRNDDGELLGELIEIVLVSIILILILPFIIYWCGYFDGWLTMKLIGKDVVNALNITFGTNLVLEDLPKIGGALGWIGGMFFKPTGFTRNRKDK